jgi:hypothetical protein
MKPKIKINVESRCRLFKRDCLFGATTTLSIMTFSITTFSITTNSIMTFDIVKNKARHSA